jgi:hypothetical protein
LRYLRFELKVKCVCPLVGEREGKHGVEKQLRDGGGGRGKMYYSSGYVTNRTVAGVRGRREGVGNTVNGVDEPDSLFRGNSLQEKLSVTMIVNIV